MSEVRPASLEVLFASATDLARALPDGIVVTDETGAILAVNARLAAMVRCSEDELLGRPVNTILSDYGRSRRAGERPGPGVSSSTPFPMRSGLGITCRRGDGTELDVDISSTAVETPDGQLVVAALRDASVRMARARERRNMDERFHLLVDVVRDYAIFMLDVHGTIISWNAGARRLKGYEASEAIGQHVSIFYTPEDIAAGAPAHLLADALSSGHVEEVGPRLRKDGSRFEALVSTTALRDPFGVLRGFANVTRDITEQVAARDLLERMRLLEQREALGRDLHDGAIQSLFAVGMELQSLEGLLRGDAAAVARITRMVDELDTLIKDLRGYIFRIGTEKTADALGDGLHALATGLALRTGVSVAVDFDDEALRATQQLAGEVLLVVKEALSNVEHHAKASTARVAVHLIPASDSGDNEVLIEIDDDGLGFDETASATGLGLANARRRAASMGARYDLTSGADGTTVRLRFPAPGAVEEGSAPAAPERGC